MGTCSTHYSKNSLNCKDLSSSDFKLSSIISSLAWVGRKPCHSKSKLKVKNQHIRALLFSKKTVFGPQKYILYLVAIKKACGLSSSSSLSCCQWWVKENKIFQPSVYLKFVVTPNDTSVSHWTFTPHLDVCVAFLGNLPFKSMNVVEVHNQDPAFPAPFLRNFVISCITKSNIVAKRVVGGGLFTQILVLWPSLSWNWKHFDVKLRGMCTFSEKNRLHSIHSNANFCHSSSPSSSFFCSSADVFLKGLCNSEFKK